MIKNDTLLCASWAVHCAWLSTMWNMHVLTGQRRYLILELNAQWKMNGPVRSDHIVYKLPRYMKAVLNYHSWKSRRHFIGIRFVSFLVSLVTYLYRLYICYRNVVKIRCVFVADSNDLKIPREWEKLQSPIHWLHLSAWQKIDYPYSNKYLRI